jgi:hypothetical protein
MASPRLAFLLIPLACCLVGFVAIALIARRSRGFRMAGRALLAGNPRRSRALTRLFARRSTTKQRALFTLFEAHALLWEGKFSRALSLLASRAPGEDGGNPGIFATIIELECLAFDHRFAEARAVLDARAATNGSTALGRADFATISAVLRFHEGDVESAREQLEAVNAYVPPRDPIARVVLFYLAAAAHRQGRIAEVRRRLAETIADGGDLFVVRWAAAQWDELFPGESNAAPAAPPPRGTLAARLPRALVEHGELALNVLILRTASIQTRQFTVDQVALLAALNVCVIVGLPFVDYSRGAIVLWDSALALAAPVLLFVVTAHVATRRSVAPGAGLRLLGAYYSASPVLLVAAFLAARRGAHGTSAVAQLLVAAWALTVVLGLVRSIVRASAAHLVLCAAIFTATWLVPMYIVGGMPMVFSLPPDVARYEEKPLRHDELVFAQADRVHAAEAGLAPGRRGVTDLYFVGAAGWADQDVFLRELRAARLLLDERFDTRDRSIILANDAFTDEALPLAANINLRHVLEAVGARMNPDEDVLFLFLTSHGSEEGLALEFAPRAAFDSQTLSPVALRSMLDDAGIKWRILVIAGCESGTFVKPLMTEFSLITTAAARDRNSYGCGNGNAFTEFGRAVFGEQLLHERSFVTAFTNAVDAVEKAEVERELRASRPQLFEGAAIGEKLRELEDRIASESPE